MTRRTINIDGSVYCADVTGALPGSLNISNATLGACTTTPPGGDDTTALARSQLVYVSHDPAHAVVNNVDMRDFAAIFGRLNSVEPNPQPLPFPGASGSTLLIPSIPRGGHIRARFMVPSDYTAGRYSGMLKAVSYGPPGRTMPPGWGRHPMRAACVRAGQDWSAANVADGSMRTGVVNSDAQLLNFGINLPTSTARVELLAGVSYDVLLAFEDAAYSGPMMLGWNFGAVNSP